MNHETTPTPQDTETDRPKQRRLRLPSRTMATLLIAATAGGVVGPKAGEMWSEYQTNKQGQETLQNFTPEDVVICKNPSVTIGGMLQREGGGADPTVVVELDVAPGPKAGVTEHNSESITPEGIQWSSPAFGVEFTLKDGTNVAGDALLYDDGEETPTSGTFEAHERSTFDPALTDKVRVTIPLNTEYKGDLTVNLKPYIAYAVNPELPTQDRIRPGVVGESCATFVLHMDEYGMPTLIEK